MGKIKGEGEISGLGEGGVKRGDEYSESQREGCEQVNKNQRATSKNLKERNEEGRY